MYQNGLNNLGFCMKIKLTNTLTRKKEDFIPLEDEKVKLYACGITPYDYAHIGHGRGAVSVDLLVRLLRFAGYDVKYVRNITDIDDKILKKAEADLGDMMKYGELAQKHIDMYAQELEQLNCIVPDEQPRVTTHIEQIIRFIEGLIENGAAYVSGSDIYFDVSSYKDYGQLSNRDVDELLAGARVEVNEQKKNPADFVLWKGNEDGQFWKAPWGYGRPGWHIECSVMAKEILGETIDIHCGGIDLVFPHHENERAQSEALHGKQFVRYWVHNALLNINKEKMSKSLGNILSLQEVFKKCDPMVVRYYFLQHQYRTPIEFSFEGIESAKTAYKKLVAVFEGVETKEHPHAQYMAHNFIAQMLEALSDDMNTPKMLGILFENLSDIKADANLAQIVKSFLVTVTGLTFIAITEDSVKITPEIQVLIEQRKQARLDKDWVLADKIRDQLTGLGVELKDRKV